MISLFVPMSQEESVKFVTMVYCGIKKLKVSLFKKMIILKKVQLFAFPVRILIHDKILQIFHSHLIICMPSLTAPESGICYSSYKMATELFKNSDWKRKLTSIPWLYLKERCQPKKHRNKNTYYLEFTDHSVVLLPTDNGHQLSTESILTILKENCNYLKLCGINLKGDLQLTNEKSQIR